MESASRVVFAVLLAVGVVDGENVAAIAIAAAPLLSLFVVPWALGRQVRAHAAPAPREPATPRSPSSRCRTGSASRARCS